MKISKPALKTPAQEECGVWLDTTQLKMKAKQKRLIRPISKLLNPFSGGGYNLSVALNFTQTKVEMPKTKQSSISTFFTPQRRVLNKMSTSEEPNLDPMLPSSSSSPPTAVASGTKRSREMDLLPVVDHEWKSEHVTEPEAAECQEETERHMPSQNVYNELEEEQFEDVHPPLSKRRLTAAYSLASDSQPPPQAWSQDPLFTYSQYSESECYPASQKNTTAKTPSDSEPSFFNSLQSEEAFCIRMELEGKTSTQKSFEHFNFSQPDDEKENRILLSSKPPKENSTVSQIEPLSNHKWTEPKTPSPKKHIPVPRWKRADEEDSRESQFEWTKPRGSPRKKLARQRLSTAVDEDSLAMLFTQDSEGFRVIAHRGLQARSPLKDQSNISAATVRTSAHKSLVEEDKEDEMLFTQDSQGNLVIKH